MSVEPVRTRPTRHPDDAEGTVTVARAEDKVGTLFPVHLTAPGLPADASFHLPISERARGDLRAFFARHCGI